MTNEWIGIEDRKEEHLGFTYIIIHKETKKYYIGKKQFYKAIRRKPLKGQKRIRKDRIESDWETYWGSSNKFNEYVKQEGTDKFERKIIGLYTCKYDLALSELKSQMFFDVLNDKNSFNEIINVRLRKRKTGTQGLKNAKDRGIIPEALFKEILEVYNENKDTTEIQQDKV